MTFEQLGNLGEFIAAIATVATLVYLTLQIRQNTSALQTTSHQAATHDAYDFTARIAGDADVARVFNTGSRDWDSLSAEDRLRFSMLLFGVFFNFQNMYALYKSHGIDEEYWNSQFAVMMWFMSFPGVIRWWQAGKVRLRSSFVVFVDQVIK
ncbi:hypothetical protein [Congregibacter sp.]|jgi:hypothetical protein|uniref:hypothetical protein n=1 Tax=Congregibacter sp. TaxID=2744308 RepID=UPI0039E402DB